MFKASSIALGLAALCATGVAHAQTGTDDLTKFTAGRSALAAQPAGTLGASQQQAPLAAGVDGKFRVGVPAPGAVATSEPSMAMNAGMSAAGPSNPLQGIAPALSDAKFGAKDNGAQADGGKFSQVLPAGTALLGVESSQGGNLNASAFGAANNVKLGVQ